MISVVGHRGAAGIEPENTLRGIARAVTLGVDAIELDVRMTLDGCPVLLHDARVDRTTNGSGRVRRLTLAEIRKLDAGTGQRIPTLIQALELVGGRAEILCELKGALKIPPAEEEVLRVVEASGSLPGVVFTSFRLERLERMRRLDQGARLEPLFRRRPDERALAELTTWRCQRIGVRHDVVDGSLVRSANAKGLSVRAWNPDTEPEWERLIAAGVTAIGTNRPDRLIRYLERLGRRPLPLVRS